MIGHTHSMTPIFWRYFPTKMSSRMMTAQMPADTSEIHAIVCNHDGGTAPSLPIGGKGSRQPTAASAMSDAVAPAWRACQASSARSRKSSSTRL